MVKNYEYSKIKDLEEGKNNNIRGKGSLSLLETKNKEEYLLLTVLDTDSSLFIPIWQRNKDYNLFKQYLSKDFYISINGTTKINHDKGNKYKNFIMHNFEIIDILDMKVDTEVLKKEFKIIIQDIKDPILRDILILSLNDNIVLSNLFTAPSSITSAYDYEGGLIHHIVDSVFTIKKFQKNKILESTFVGEVIDFNYDLLIVSAILSLLGKTYTLYVDKDSKVYKTFKGELADDILYSRDIAVSSISKIKSNKINELNNATDKNHINDINNYLNVLLEYEDEIIHIISSYKGPLQFGSVTTPRSKYSLFLSNIMNIVFNRYIFAKLEQEKKILNNNFLRLFDGGKIYKV